MWETSSVLINHINWLTRCLLYLLFMRQNTDFQFIFFHPYQPSKFGYIKYHSRFQMHAYFKSQLFAMSSPMMDKIIIQYAFKSIFLVYMKCNDHKPFGLAILILVLWHYINHYLLVWTPMHMMMHKFAIANEVIYIYIYELVEVWDGLHFCWQKILFV